MTDNELISLIATRLRSALAAKGWAYLVVQKNQPTQQGIPTDPTIFVEKTLDIFRGWPMLDYTQPVPAGDYNQRETQLCETTIQISGIVRQQPSDLSIPTSSDAVAFLSQFMSSRNTVQFLKASSANILRVSEARNPYFEDDTHRFQAFPNFDLTMSHSRFVDFSVPAAITAEEILFTPVPDFI